ncbi:MAG: hypothetical protein FWG49_00085 [Leptospirales bacterium]|nr:hypothetical protein [Leptospirales bacterium]
MDVFGNSNKEMSDKSGAYTTTTKVILWDIEKYESKNSWPAGDRRLPRLTYSEYGVCHLEKHTIVNISKLMHCSKVNGKVDEVYEASAKVDGSLRNGFIFTVYEGETQIGRGKIAENAGKKNKENTYITKKNRNTVLLYLAFYDSKEKMFEKTAQTRRQNIYKSEGYDENIHKVHCHSIQDISELHVIIPNYIKEYGCKEVAFCKEVSIFSHAALDGPRGHVVASRYPLIEDNKKTKQMSLEGWGRIDFNWSNDSKFVMFGCRTAVESDAKRNFSKKISSLQNFKDVEIWGQPSYTYPSFYPTHRVSTGIRHMGIFLINQVYMVAQWDKTGQKSTYKLMEKNSAWNLTKQELEKYPEALPMNCYRNGIKVRVAPQSYFNTHLEKIGL